MKNFLDANFLLQTKTAETLYRSHAAPAPIIDYHCHLNPADIARDRRFENLGAIWLEGDHYKWRAMRANGIDEKYITGKETSDFEKFQKFAETVPFTMRNPIYHWTHLELQRVFGITKLLSPATAHEIFDECSSKLQTPEFSVRSLLKKFDVRVVCTTDDPADSLEHHAAIKRDNFPVKILPTWRPDKLMAVEKPAAFIAYIEQLGAASGVAIATFDDLLNALKKRHAFFASLGCKLSDHGFDRFYAEDYTHAEISSIFKKLLAGTAPTPEEANKFKSAILFEGAVMDCDAGWTQQFHVGPLRNNSARLMKRVGADAGCDSIGDLLLANNMARFLDKLDSAGKLGKTILYNLNPRDNEVFATMAGNFQDGTVPGKIQFGSGWWFMDQKDGMEAQMNTLSQLGLLSRFVGMLTDSRSFMSFPRHEYFRRILCNLLGNDVENGLLPASELPLIGKMVEDICYNNAKKFFVF